MMATAAAAPSPQAEHDPRRITEHDPALKRLKARTIRQLIASINQLVRELRNGEQSGQAQSHFIQRHVAIMRAAYRAAHREGQLDYYGAVSRVPKRWATHEPDEATLNRRLAFYAPSVAKMAYEAVQAYTMSAVAAITASSDRQTNAEGHSEQSETVRLAGGIGEREDNLAKWQSSLGARITLQADLTWSGGQDGYVQAGWADSANPFQALYWNLQPTAQHCDQCPAFAAGSPYDPPWVQGGNILNATPGDGTTDCGAGCKCGLSYGPPAYGSTPKPMVSPQQWAPQDIPPEVQNQPPAHAPVPPPAPGAATETPAGRPGGGMRGDRPALIPGGDLNAGQKRALDLYRLAELEWNAVRGELPELPNFFTLAVPGQEFEFPRLKWELLTPRQRRALEMAFEAYAVWDAWVPQEWRDFYDEYFHEPERGEYLLFNPYPRQSHGRFGYGGDHGAHPASGGGSHGAAQHAGAGHIGTHVGAHAAAGSGGGGAGGTAKAAAAKPAKTPKAPKVAKPKTTKAAKTTPAKPRAAPKPKATKTTKEPTREELQKAADARLAKAKKSMTKAESDLKKAQKAEDVNRSDPAKKATIERLSREYNAVSGRHSASYTQAREALLESRAHERGEAGKAAKAYERMKATKEPYEQAAAKYRDAQAHLTAAKAKADQLFEKYRDEYSQLQQKYSYQAYDKIMKAHPDLKTAEKERWAAERVKDKAERPYYTLKGRYESARATVAGENTKGKITDKDIEAHPLRVQARTELDAARARLDEVTGHGKVVEAQRAKAAAEHELKEAQAGVDHPTWKYPLNGDPTAAAKYSDPEHWPTAALTAAQRAETTGKQRIQNGELDRHVGDLALHSLQHEQGFDGKPNIVSEAELAAGIKKGDIEIWRGDTKIAHTDNYMIGEYHAGLGIRGNGTYAQEHSHSGLIIAKSYALAHGNKGLIMHASIKHDAKVIEYEKLLADKRRDEQRIKDQLTAARERGDKAEVTRLKQALWVVQGDSSRYAVARGFDAIRIPSHGQVIVLNRTALRISNQVRSGEDA